MHFWKISLAYFDWIVFGYSNVQTHSQYLQLRLLKQLLLRQQLAAFQLVARYPVSCYDSLVLVRQVRLEIQNVPNLHVEHLLLPYPNANTNCYLFLDSVCGIESRGMS